MLRNSILKCYYTFNTNYLLLCLIDTYNLVIQDVWYNVNNCFFAYKLMYLVPGRLLMVKLPTWSPVVLSYTLNHFQSGNFVSKNLVNLIRSLVLYFKNLSPVASTTLTMHLYFFITALMIQKKKFQILIYMYVPFTTAVR